MKKWFCLTAICFEFICLPQVPAPSKMQIFVKRYAAAASGQKRLELCIEAINQGLINRGQSVGNIDQIFGTDYAKRIPAKNHPLESGVIDFFPQTPSPSTAIAAARTGWYLAFEFDHQGSLQNYYLSNLHK